MGVTATLPRPPDAWIVWRMDGQGDLHIAAATTDGTHAKVTSGPKYHGAFGSSWYQPGTEEWGTSFIFPKAGCWRLHVYRNDVGGDVYYLVAGPA
jgi:hypothetical protein